jgi:hypothetical protein
LWSSSTPEGHDFNKPDITLWQEAVIKFDNFWPFCSSGDEFQKYRILFLHFCDYPHFQEDLLHYLYKFELSLRMDDLYQVWLILDVIFKIYINFSLLFPLAKKMLPLIWVILNSFPLRKCQVWSNWSCGSREEFEKMDRH